MNTHTSFWADSQKWKHAILNTLTCLVGCSMGDVGCLVLFQWYGFSMQQKWTMLVSMLVGMVSSILLETLILKLREKFTWRVSIQTALGMSFISMLIMELAENMTDYYLTNGGQVPMSDPYYWMALLISMGAGFLVPLPYNYYKIKKYNHACHA